MGRIRVVNAHGKPATRVLPREGALVNWVEGFGGGFIDFFLAVTVAPGIMIGC